MKANAYTVMFLMLGTGIWAAHAQPPNSSFGPPPGGPHGAPPKPPIEAALDTNGNGTIEADEIANAAAALKTLDKNGDGQLTADELRPAMPEAYERN